MILQHVATNLPISPFTGDSAIKPIVVVTHRIHSNAIELLSSVCEVIPVILRSDTAHAELLVTLRHAHALLLPTAERIDAVLLSDARELCIVACAFHIPEHIDVSACSRSGVWVTNTPADCAGSEAELIAARNTLDALSGDTPRDALNAVPGLISLAARRDRRQVAAIV